MEKFRRILGSSLQQLSAIMVYIMVLVGLQLVFYKDLMGTDKVLINILYILIELVLLVIFIFIFRNKYVPDYYDFKKNGKTYIKKNFYIYIIGLVVMVVSNLIINLFVKSPLTNQELNESLLLRLPVYGILSTVVFAPLIEEALTRACFKDTFDHNIIYYVLSGLIFGALHLINAKTVQELFYIIPYGTLGYSFAVMYKKSNNIWTNIFFHALHNAIAISVIFLGAL